MQSARLTRYGLLSVSGADAREFLHAQLTNDIRNLARDRAALAGWCSPKGRLLATFLVVPWNDGFLLQLAKDLVAPVQKRLSMFVLRAKVKIEDASDRWRQLAIWGASPDLPLPAALFEVRADEGRIFTKMGDDRFLVLAAQAASVTGEPVPESRWAHDEILAGRALITAATQDLFVPQMVNYEKVGAVSFQKGCYPGQEVVARAQYRGQVKRRMARLPAPPGAEPAPGQEVDGGVVVDSAEGEMLAVVPVSE